MLTEYWMLEPYRTMLHVVQESCPFGITHHSINPAMARSSQTRTLQMALKSWALPSAAALETAMDSSVYLARRKENLTCARPLSLYLCKATSLVLHVIGIPFVIPFETQISSKLKFTWVMAIHWFITSWHFMTLATSLTPSWDFRLMTKFPMFSVLSSG